MTDRFKKGDEIKYPNPNADMDGSPETLTRTLDAHDAAIVNAALEPTYCAECAENGLVLPHPCPRVTVAPLAVTPNDETDCAEVYEHVHVVVDPTCPEGVGFMVGTVKDDDGTERITAVKIENFDTENPADPAPEGEGPERFHFEANGLTIFVPEGFVSGRRYGFTLWTSIEPEVAMIERTINNYIDRAHAEGFTAGQKRELLHIASLESDPLHEYLTGQKGRSDCAEVGVTESLEHLLDGRANDETIDVCSVWNAIHKGQRSAASSREGAEPPSPDLVAAVKGLLDLQKTVPVGMSEKPTQDQAAEMQRAIDRLSAALQNTPQPDESEAVKLRELLHEAITLIGRWDALPTGSIPPFELTHNSAKFALRGAIALSNTPEVDR